METCKRQSEIVPVTQLKGPKGNGDARYQLKGPKENGDMQAVK